MGLDTSFASQGLNSAIWTPPDGFNLRLQLQGQGSPLLSTTWPWTLGPDNGNSGGREPENQRYGTSHEKLDRSSPS